MKKALIALTLITISISSCTIEKRLHRGGWHVEWKGNYRGTSDKTDTEKPSDNLAETPVAEDEIKTNETVTATPEKKVVETTPKKGSEKKVSETKVIDQQSAVAQTETVVEEPAAITPIETLAAASDELPGNSEQQAVEPKKEEAKATPADDSGNLPIDPLMLAAYIISGVILLALLIYIGGPILALTTGAATGLYGFGGFFWLGYILLAVANIVLLGFASAREETLRDSYRYPPKWPVWLVTFLPAFLGLVAIAIFLVAWGW